MTVGDSDLRIRPGRIRSTRAPKPKSFINQVLRAAKKAGHTSVRPWLAGVLRPLGARRLAAAGFPLAAADYSARRGELW
ncbi:hypothetical protein ACVWZZ_003222 [Bradyrhizobium sp. LM6.10]